jgi:hypothetical protein
MFGMSSTDLELTLDGCYYILEQAAYSSISPEELFQVMQELGCDEAYAKVISIFVMKFFERYFLEMKEELVKQIHFS